MKLSEGDISLVDLHKQDGGQSGVSSNKGRKQ